MFLIFKGGSGTISELGTVWVLAKLYYGHHKPFILYGKHWIEIIDTIKKNMNKKKKGKEGMKDIPITQSSKTDLEGRLQREPHVNSMAAKGENGGHGYSKSIKGKK